MSEIEKRVAKAIQEKVFPGCVIGVVRKNASREVFPFGHLTYESDSPKVTENTVYDLASVTKSIPVASLAALFISENRLNLSDKIVTYIPELQNDHDATIEDLLRYRIHGVQLSKLRLQTFEEVRTRALEHGFDAAPGESIYTNLPAFILGMILERVGNSSIAALADKHFFEPLRMIRTTFFPTPSDCAPTEIDERGEVRGFPHDESAYVFAKARRSVGHAGLFSTAPDLLNFLELLLGTPKYIGLPYVSLLVSAIVACAQDGLGWQREGALLGSQPGKRFGKTGFTGTSVVVDLERGIALTILSNRTWPHRPENSDAINRFRADIADIVFGA